MATEVTENIEDTLVPGTLFAQRFVIERVLGRGGMGVVFAARHVELDETVAIKLMLPQLAANVETAGRFFREARASVRIKSDYIVRVLDVARLDDGTPYIVMEYLEGTDLDTLLQEQGSIEVAAACRYLIQTADAIAAAHAIGIIHRDIKPQNLFLAKQGDDSYRIKVLDFGISKISLPLNTLDASLTQTSSVIGSPLYMSPEQMQSSKTVDGRSDIWALGCVLFELVTGEPPFNAPTMPELCAAIFTAPTPIATRVRPDLPKSLNAIIARCLEKLPEQRYASVAQLAQDLLAYAPDASSIVASIVRRRSSMPPPSSEPLSRLASPPKVPAITANSWGHITRPPQQPKARTSVVSLGIAGAAAAIAVVLFLSLRHTVGTSTPASTAAVVNDRAAGTQSRAAEPLVPQLPQPKGVLQDSIDAGTEQLNAPPVASGDARRAKRTPIVTRAANLAPTAAKSPSDTPAASATFGGATRAPSLKIDIK